MSASRLFVVAAPALLALRLLGNHPAGRPMVASNTTNYAASHADSTLVNPDSEPMVAEAKLPPGAGWFFIPVMLQGRSSSLILDTGTGYYLYLLTPSLSELNIKLPHLKLPPPEHKNPMLDSVTDLDSITIGTFTEKHVRTGIGRFSILDTGITPSGLPPLVGILGNYLLPHYDILFDIPNRRARLYQIASPSAHHTWLPAGLTPADCTPLTPDPDTLDKSVSIGVTVNGKSVPNSFDTGAGVTVMNAAAATMLGLHASSSEETELHNVVIGIGDGHLKLTIPEVHVSPEGDEPFLQFGLDTFRDRLMLISYSTQQLCLGTPRQAPAGH